MRSISRQQTWRLARHGIVRLHRPVRRYARKFGGAEPTVPARPSWTIIAVAWLGGLFALALLGGLAEATHAPLMMAPFGASAVLLFGHPDSPLTQPRNVIGGHLIGALLGLSLGLLGDGWMPMALAVATTIAAMKATRSVHPPAGATAIIAIHLHADWTFAVAPVLIGSVVLVLAAAVYNNAIEHRRYPLRWW